MTNYVVSFDKKLATIAEEHIDKRKKQKRDINKKIREKQLDATAEKQDWKNIELEDLIDQVENGDSVYLNMHGTGKIIEHIDGSVSISSTKKVEWNNGKKLTANEFVKEIKPHLPKEANFKLKIFACYSAGSKYDDDNNTMLNDDTFAGQVASLLYEDYKNIIVYGYKDETSFTTNSSGNPQQSAGGIANFWADGHYKPDPKAVKHPASSHRVIFEKGRDVDSWSWKKWNTST